ncbi:site-specific integrase [Aquimarina sp. 2201CG14-23]|uniref:site-specific integrase n=1 Tax=Aquimarina mycalae TaxID=3040073 RepID=UPI002478046F|nr:site-specific integrase [Aquimarina sp. 2201CG14-23]MDH7444646.1 site-specific integrase [Aquimarina sp. 2201CG14-23]
MKATVKLYTTDGLSNGLYPVKLIVTHQKKIKRKTIGYSSADDWDDFNQLPKTSHDDFENLYGVILDYRKKAVAGKFKSLLNVTEGLQYFEGSEKKEVNFYDFADKEITRMKKLGRNGNADAYQYAINELKKFSPYLKFNQIDRIVLENFKQYKKEEGNKNTTIRTYLYEIRAIYNKAVRMGLTEDNRPFVGLFLDLPVRVRRHKNEYLDRNGIEVLRKAKNLSKEQQIAVDLTLLQYYFCGADLVDVYYLKKKQLVNGRVYFTRKKLGVKGYEFDVKIMPEAKLLIDKYISTETEYVFPWRKDDVGYKTFRSNHNRKMERVQKNLEIDLMPKGGKLTSKVVRHTFATLGKFAHVDPDILRELMGHERNDIDTAYKDKFPEKIRDKVHKKIIK